MKKFGLWLYDWYNYIFDHKINPLRHIPDPTTRFFLMFYLSVAWSGAFALWAGSWQCFLSPSLYLLMQSAKAICGYVDLKNHTQKID